MVLKPELYFCVYWVIFCGLILKNIYVYNVYWFSNDLLRSVVKAFEEIKIIKI